MKLLLTSAGITNKSINNALLKLNGKPFEESSMVFIPTAANVEPGDKDWLIDDLSRCKDTGIHSIDIVDISAIPREMWEPRLLSADIIVVGGGNTYHLMYWMNKSGLTQIMPELLQTKVYMGISAGSMVQSTNLALSQSTKMYAEYMGNENIEKGLGNVHFHIRPHLNSPWFPHIRQDFIEEKSKKLKEPVYAIDDQTAIQILDDTVTIVSEGSWLTFNMGAVATIE